MNTENTQNNIHNTEKHNSTWQRCRRGSNIGRADSMVSRWGQKWQLIIESIIDHQNWFQPKFTEHHTEMLTIKLIQLIHPSLKWLSQFLQTDSPITEPIQPALTDSTPPPHKFVFKPFTKGQATREVLFLKNPLSAQQVCQILIAKHWISQKIAELMTGS